MEAPAAFFKRLDTGNLPRWVGELYLAGHRGTYTTQAKTKKGNRRSEIMLREAELWGAVASVSEGLKFPLTEMNGLWREVLLNQFHDIIPGSSIARVYGEAEKAYSQVIDRASAIAGKARVRMVNRDSKAATVFNSLSWSRDSVVKMPSGFTKAVTDAGVPVPVQRHEGGVYGLVRGIPSCGMASLHKAKAAGEAPSVKATAGCLENELLRVTFNKRGEITSVYDKEHGIEFAQAPCNAFHLYKDVPSQFDAWDINSMYKEQEVPLRGAAALHMSAEGPVFGMLRLARTIGQSRIEQEIVLCAGSRRIEFRTRVDWRETHKLLKVNFPVNVKSEDALHEIQFGHVRRPTHSTLPYDGARFEVCNQKWTALAEENRGAAVLNDCKYGVNVDGSSINLTLLRSPLMPDMTADKGAQEFTYAFYCWAGPFRDSGVIREAYELNVPVTVVPGKAVRTSLFSLSDPAVVIEAIKPAEDGSGDIVLRLYEATRSSVTCTLATCLPVRHAAETDMLERELRKLKCSREKITLSFRPFEIKTIRLGIE
jgi:alpha-mannosidase